MPVGIGEPEDTAQRRHEAASARAGSWNQSSRRPGLLEGREAHGQPVGVRPVPPSGRSRRAPLPPAAAKHGAEHSSNRHGQHGAPARARQDRELSPNCRPRLSEGGAHGLCHEIHGAFPGRPRCFHRLSSAARRRGLCDRSGARRYRYPPRLRGKIGQGGAQLVQAVQWIDAERARHALHHARAPPRDVIGVGGEQSGHPLVGHLPANRQVEQRPATRVDVRKGDGQTVPRHGRRRLERHGGRRESGGGLRRHREPPATLATASDLSAAGSRP